ncbi:MAG TPA: DUF6585 family protein [Streptosporangiaceae bacterium]|nr:DUF6585 family protein [Streptosporangiaceae bacterium]
MSPRAQSSPERVKHLQDWARALGQTHGLGECLTASSLRPLGLTRRYGILLAYGGVLLGVPWTLLSSGSSRQLFESVAAAAVVLGIASALVPINRAKPEWAAVYTGGIAQVPAGGGTARVITWQGLDHESQHWRERPTSPNSQATYHDLPPRIVELRVTGQDGTVITVGKRYGSLAEIANQVEDAVAAARLPDALQRYESGAPVSFGHFEVSREGIAWRDGAKGKAWGDIRSIDIYDYEIHISTGPLAVGPTIRRHDDTPNWGVATRLIREAAGREGITGDRLRLVPSTTRGMPRWVDSFISSAAKRRGPRG